MGNSPLNAFFDKIFCITCPCDVERQNACIDQFFKYNIVFDFIPAINANLLKPPDKVIDWPGVSTAELSLSLAHQTCFHKAKLHKYDKIAIFEDDFVLHDDWQSRFELFITELPDIWSILHLGQATWTLGIHDTQRVPYSNAAAICKYGCASHFMGFHNSIYDVCIEKINTCSRPVDLYYSDLMKIIDTCYTPTERSFADAISMPHERYHADIKNFDITKYIPSALRNTSFTP